MKIIIAYVPVFHEGYKKFFDRHKNAKKFYIFGTSLIKEFDYLRKEIRAIAPKAMEKLLRSLYGKKVIVLSKSEIKKLQKTEKLEIIVPDEDVTKELVAQYFPGAKVKREKVFLRWDRENSLKKKNISPGRTIRAKQFEKELFKDALEEGDKTGDWWLQVGALIVKDGKILFRGHARHHQSPHLVWSEGDPRNAFNKGINIDLNTSLHAERGMIADAAREGVSLKGASMYVTHFPCPTCAQMIAVSGIVELFYLSGYAVLDGQRVLDEAGVKIVKVEGVRLPKKRSEFIPYKKRPNQMN